MFTGIITDIGRIVDAAEENGRRFVIEAAFDLAAVPIGASIAHSGVCLTVTAKDEAAGRYDVYASPETLSRTTLGSWKPGTAVNLERSLRLGDELGGHLVFGHVDGIGAVRAIEPEGDSRRIVFEMPASLAPMVAVKGSIAVDGISLTVTEAGQDSFAVSVIPHTWDATTLAQRREGDAVNLEIDMLARYVARQIAHAAGEARDA